MVGSNIKEEAMALMDRRSAIEEEIDVIISGLCSGGGPGVSGSLVDAQGFPRADIDIPGVRSLRRRLHALRNDHKDITHKIDQLIHLLHSPNLEPAPAPTIAAVDLPFSVVDQITEGSPAAQDGLQLGDQLVKFGALEYAHNSLQRLAAEAQQNQGRQLPVLVIRQGVPVNLTITPRTWGGPGLLGCHFQML